MTELPVDPKIRAALPPERGESGFMRPQWIAIAFIVLGLAAAIFAFLNTQALGVIGSLAILVGLAGVGGLLVYALRGGDDVNSLSRAPIAALNALNAIPDPAYLTDKRGAMIFSNEAYRSLSALFDPERTSSIERLLAGHDDVSDSLFRLSQAARTGFTAQEEVNVPGRLGTEPRLYSIQVRPLGGREGGALWLMRDIGPERARLSEAKLAGENALAYLDQLPMGVFATKGEEEIVYLNPVLAGWLGIETEDYKGLKLSDMVMGDVSSLSRAEDEKGVAALDADLRRENGEAMPVRILRRSGANENGLHAALVMDSARGKGDLSSRDAELRFTRFFNNAPMGIATVDGEGKIENANSAFLLVVKGGTARGKPVSDFIHEEDRDALREHLGRARMGEASGPALDVRLAGRADSAAQLYVSRIDRGDEASGLVVYLIDATAQKSLEMQFTQSQKMQAVGQLAGGVAHDFNNLLTAIIGFCDLLLSRHQAGDPSFADVMQIRNNANRAANLTRQLLAFSRRQTLRLKVLSLTDALAELSNLLARLLTEKIELKIVHSRDLGLVKVDQNQLEQVIMNLAVNARDAMPDGGKLTIRTANVTEEDSRALDHAMMPPAEYVLIEVSDTGVGIAKENIDKIFEPFYTTKDPSKGTGLGLSTVYGIVKQTGGFVFPYSTPGKGTSFHIYLPRYFETEEDKAVEAAEKAEEAIVAAQPAADLTGKGTILLVEDEDAVRTFAARALATRGYEVIQAESGEAALSVVDDHLAAGGKIDLIVSDVVMPNMDGPTMIKELATKLPGIQVIFVSGYAEDAFAKSLDPSQVFHFLPKPFSLKQLAAAVKDVMGGG
jgi:two-component system cell cycle sensor histidine kinase/response regulator CckA